MNIKDAKEDAQADTLAVRRLNSGDLSDFAIGGRNDQARLDRHRPLGIAEEPEKKAGEQNRYDCPNPIPRHQEYQDGSRNEPKTVEVSVTHHVRDQTLGEL